jgi:Tol biopolymer transport system component
MTKLVLTLIKTLEAQMKTKYIHPLIILLLFSGLLSACRTLDVGIETAAPAVNKAIVKPATDTPQAVLTTTPVQPTSTPEPTVVIIPQSSPTVEAAATATQTPAQSSPFSGLIYRLGDQLYRINSDGQKAPLAPGLDPQVLPNQFTPRAVFSPDGKTMISWWDFSDLWLVDLTTGKSQNLTHTTDRVEFSAQYWPARPGTIIFMSQSVTDQGPSNGYLSTIQLDGSGYRVLDETGSSIGLPALSTDGQTIAYDRGGEAWLYRWDSGSEPIDLASFEVNGYLKVANPAWSPKGKYLAWMAGADPTNPDSNAGVGLFNMDAHSYRLLHPFQSLGHGGWYITPVWSPDGTWLAVYDESQSQPGIWVMHPDGSGESLVFSASSVRSVGGLEVMWGADSKQLLVVDPNAEGGLRWECTDITTGNKVGLPLPEGSLPIAWIH